MASVTELEARRDELKKEIAQLDSENAGQRFSEEDKARWNDMNKELEDTESTLAEINSRTERISALGENERNTVPGDGAAPSRFDKSVQVSRTRVPSNIYDLYEYRTNSRDPEDEARLLTDGAMKSIETSDFPAHRNQADAQTAAEHVIKTTQGPEGWTPEQVKADLARRILSTGSPAYHRAFWKALPAALKGVPPALTSEEARALSVGTGSAGGFAVVYQLDPTVVPTSNFSVNPYRAIGRSVTITGTNEWKAVTSGAITASYTAEATEATDNAPTLAQPDIIVEKAQAYVPFSIEIGQDWGALESEMGQLLQDAKDDLEATKFTSGAGHGSQEPKGIITAATTTVGTTTTGAFVIADLYKLWEALPPRFRPRATYLGNLFTYDKIRQFDTAGGSGVWFGQPGGLQPQVGGETAGTVTTTGQIATLLGRPAYESTAMDAALTTGSKILVAGDFGRYFVIVDRVGMNVEVLPLVVGTNHRPTGQRGLYAYWRNSSDVLSAAAFRVLLT